MPFYQYKCDCGNEQEEMHGMEERPIIRCAICGLSMRKKFTVPRVNFNAFDSFEFLTKPRGSQARREFDQQRGRDAAHEKDVLHDLAATMEGD